MINILIVCTGNSCRSQMAEGWLKSFSKTLNVYSAGTCPEPVNTHAILVMKEVGIDISSNLSNHIEEYSDVYFDYVFTVCDSANESCPALNSTKIIHKSFSDPAKSVGSKEEVLYQYRHIRDLLKDYFFNFFNTNLK